MFDLNKLTETLGGLFSGSQTESGQAGGGIADLLAQAGVDPNLLDGLTSEEIANLLSQHGIDPNTIDPATVTQLLGDNAGGLAQAAAEWLGSRRG